MLGRRTCHCNRLIIAWVGSLVWFLPLHTVPAGRESWGLCSLRLNDSQLPQQQSLQPPPIFSSRFTDSLSAHDKWQNHPGLPPPRYEPDRPSPTLCLQYLCQDAFCQAPWNKINFVYEKRENFVRPFEKIHTRRMFQVYGMKGWLKAKAAQTGAWMLFTCQTHIKTQIIKTIHMSRTDIWRIASAIL